jgi:hypothetical protein
MTCILKKKESWDVKRSAVVNLKGKLIFFASCMTSATKTGGSSSLASTAHNPGMSLAPSWSMLSNTS